MARVPARRQQVAYSRERGLSARRAVMQRAGTLRYTVSNAGLHQRMARPIAQDPANIFPRDARHCGKVILGDFLLNHDAPLPDVTTKFFGKAQEHASNASLE